MQGRSPLLSVKISFFDVFKQLLTLHKLTPTSDATSLDLLRLCFFSISNIVIKKKVIAGVLGTGKMAFISRERGK